MKRVITHENDDADMLPEYEVPWSKAQRGKHAKLFDGETSLVAIDADLQRFFPDARAVNDALREIVAQINAPHQKPA